MTEKSFPLAKSIWVLLIAVGCQQQRQPDYASLGLVPVTGVVRLDGKPLSNVTVIFENEDGGFAHGRTNELGGYRLMYTSEQPGTLPGRKVVRITSFPIGEGERGRSAPAEEIVPAEYNVRSKQTVEVTADRKVFDFELKSDR